MGKRYNQGYVFYKFEKDEESGGLAPFDDDGAVLNAEQIETLINGLQKFKESYSEEMLEYSRNKILNDSKFEASKFIQPKHKSGYVFIYKEHITNKYRLVATQDYKSRLKTLRYEYPTSLELIAIKETTDVDILKEILIDEYNNYHSHENWFDLTQEAIAYFKNEDYHNVFKKNYELKSKSITDSIQCNTCRKEINNIDQLGYYRCMSCRATYCSEECLNKQEHVCKRKI